MTILTINKPHLSRVVSEGSYGSLPLSHREEAYVSGVWTLQTNCSVYLEIVNNAMTAMKLHWARVVSYGSFDPLTL